MLLLAGGGERRRLGGTADGLVSGLDDGADKLLGLADDGVNLESAAAQRRAEMLTGWMTWMWAELPGTCRTGSVGRVCTAVVVLAGSGQMVENVGWKSSSPGRWSWRARWTLLL